MLRKGGGSGRLGSFMALPLVASDFICLDSVFLDGWYISLVWIVFFLSMVSYISSIPMHIRYNDTFLLSGPVVL